MAQVIFKQSSKQEAYAKMAKMGFAGSYGKVGFTDFTIRTNFGLSEDQKYHKEMTGEGDEYSIVGYSNYHVDATIIEQYESDAKGWKKS